MPDFGFNAVSSHVNVCVASVLSSTWMACSIYASSCHEHASALNEFVHQWSQVTIRATVTAITQSSDPVAEDSRPPVRYSRVIDEEVMDEVKDAVPNKGSRNAEAVADLLR
jgi:hypothetical protein